MIEEGYDVGFDLALLNPIRLTENEIRLVERNGQYLISESDFESVFFNYNSELNGYEILNLIAEAHNIKSNDIIIMMSEGKAMDANMVAKKALVNKVNNQDNDLSYTIERLKAKLSRLQFKLKETNPATEDHYKLKKEIISTENAIKSLLKINKK